MSAVRFYTFLYHPKKIVGGTSIAFPTSTLAWIHTGAANSKAPLSELLRLEKRPLPPLKFGTALLQIDAAPVNPSDVMYIRGQYGVQPNAGDVPGFEGCATVLAANAGPYGWYLKGKRVSFGGEHGNGSWAQYAVIDAFECIPVSKSLAVEASGTLLVNPLTAFGLIAKARKHRAKAIVMNAAASALGPYVFKLAQAKGIGFIGLVRRDESANQLRDLGVEHVFVTSEDGYLERLKSVVRELSATVLLDAVAGEQTADLMNCLPDRSHAIVYGQLSQQSNPGRISFDPDGFVFRKQTVEGYWLTDDLEGFSGIVTTLYRAWLIARYYKKGIFEVGQVHSVALDNLIEEFEKKEGAGKTMYVRDD